MNTSIKNIIINDANNIKTDHIETGKENIPIRKSRNKNVVYNNTQISFNPKLSKILQNSQAYLHNFKTVIDNNYFKILNDPFDFEIDTTEYFKHINDYWQFIAMRELKFNITGTISETEEYYIYGNNDLSFDYKSDSKLKKIFFIKITTISTSNFNYNLNMKLYNRINKDNDNYYINITTVENKSFKMFEVKYPINFIKSNKNGESKNNIGSIYLRKKIFSNIFKFKVFNNKDKPIFICKINKCDNNIIFYGLNCKNCNNVNFVVLNKNTKFKISKIRKMDNGKYSNNIYQSGMSIIDFNVTYLCNYEKMLIFILNIIINKLFFNTVVYNL